MKLLSREDVAKIESLTDAKSELKKYVDLLRTTLAINGKLEERVKDLSGQVELGKQDAFLTREQIEEMKRKMFGSSSEKQMDESPGPLFDGAGEEPEYETVTRKKRKKFGRKAQPDLPRVIIAHEYDEKRMAAAGLKKWEGQFEVSELISVIPTKIVIEEHRRQKYLATKDRDPTLPAIVTAPGPLKTKDGSRYSLEFDIEVALGKYLWHLPLDRQVRMFAAQGLSIESQTLFGRIDTLAWYLEMQVMPRIVAEIMAQKVKLADETTWQNLGKRTKHIKKKKFYFWAVRAARAICFSAFDGRSGKIAKSFLKDIDGILLVDGYKGYNVLASKDLIIARDWVHGRRKFVAAKTSEKKIAVWFIKKIDRLFRIERRIKGAPLDFVKRMRDRFSRPVVEEIKRKLEELAPKTLPRSALGKAIDYLQTYWPGLMVFLEYPEVPIHTNAIEGAIRHPVVGRNNHHGSNNLKTAQMAAVFYSIVETCKINGVDPRRYLMMAMTAILTKKPVPMPWDLVENPVSKTVESETPTPEAENEPETALAAS
ncbi:MAG: IS66 family transposase [Acidimicrobiales bacterium]